jgi:signal transduction histidine kinase/DNA-binding response OmpR family regulator
MKLIIKNHFYNHLTTIIQMLICFLILSISFNAYAVNIPQTPENQADSLNLLLKNCTTDTCRFNILSNYFWQYANTDLERVRTIGEQAFEEIKHSANLRALSDGYDIMGFILREDNWLDSAYFFFEKALEYSKAIGYKFRMAWSYYHLGEINYLFGNHIIALEDMKHAQKLFYEIASYSQMGKSINYIADVYERLGVFDSTITYYDYKLALDISNSDSVSEVITSLAISNFYKNRNESIKSIEYLKSALRKAEVLNNPKTLTSVYSAIGDFFIEQKRNYVIARSYYNKVLEIAETNNIKSLKASLYNQIGNIYLSEDMDSLALEYNLKSLALAKELKHRHTISDTYKSLGYIYKKLGDYPSALNSFKACYETGCNICPVIEFHKALIETGNIYLTLNDFNQSLSWYEKSLGLAEKYHSVEDIALSKFMLGNYYGKSGQSAMAEKYYLESIQLAEGIGNILLTRNIADTLGSFYMVRNNYPAAYHFLQLSGIMADSLFDIERQADMTELEMKFEFEKIKRENEARLALSAEEIKKQKIIRNASVVFALLLITSGLITFAGYRRKKRDNRLLTDQKNQIEQKNREIESQVKEITNQKNEIERISNELHESDEMKLRFFSNVSHELRTPLTLIINPAEKLLKTFTGNEESKKHLELIYNNAQKLHDLTNQIMDLQKLDAGNLQLIPEKADIVEYCMRIASSFESLCHKKNNTIIFSANHYKVTAFFDKDKIAKILTNLLLNAFKFCYNNSNIVVMLEMDENKFKLSVADQGIGIPGDQKENVFKRYYQVPADNHVTGTGIGLAYVKELVGFMKGEVSIESIIKAGTKVSISVPVDKYSIEDISEYYVEIPSDVTRTNIKEFNVKELIKEDESESTVLIVEDNDELRDFIADLLRPDFNIRLAKDGQEGLRTAFQYIPDIIISDVIMPGTNGFELCSTLKKDERTSHIPVILLTARDSSQSSLEGYKTGADDYIIKPFDDELLKLKVRNIIATNEAGRKQLDFKSLLAIEGLKIGDTDKRFIKKCLTVIEKYINNSGFTVDNLAEELSFSSRNLYRKIKALTNQTPAELIRVYRLHYAKRLLQNTKMRVFEIALAVGYEDVNRFRQAYKKYFGFLPSESIDKTTV